ncbi:LanC-like protein [Colletotrichum camelliae]|nr:LanC-like protein [Colletotrichum camelliae]
MAVPIPPESRFIPNNVGEGEYLTFCGDPEALIHEALTHVIVDTPPLAEYSNDQCRGLFRGPTSLAFLFLKLDAQYPSMQVQDQLLSYWAGLYASAKRLGENSAPCGLACESVALLAVQTMMDEANAPAFCNELKRLVAEDHPFELLFGYVGLLYMIRAVESWRPNVASSLSLVKARMVEKTLGAGPGWVWRGKRYIGAVHGDIGILTQLLLTDPKLASNLMIKNALRRLLSLQREDGNWTTKDDDDIRYEGLVQFCHGAPGFVDSLLHICRLFPDMHDIMDEAIERGQQAVWNTGLLRKDPCICHGILGNAMVLPSGPRRDHFLAWALPAAIEEKRQEDETLFVPESPQKMSAWFNYWPGVAWTWSQYAKEIPGVILYSEV